MPTPQILRTPLAALVALLLLSACTSPEVASARLAQIRGFQNDIETHKIAAQAGDKAAKYQVCFASYRVAELSSPAPGRRAAVTDEAWERCSSSAKDGTRHAQYLTGYLLTNFQPSYSWNMEGPQRYGEAISWYKQSMDQGYEPAREQYVYYKDWYDKKYGAQKSDLFGKVLAGAMVAGIGVYAKADSATIANAVGAFAADASTQGQAQASANFMQNSGTPQKPTNTGSSPTTKSNATSTSPAQQPSAGRPVAAAKGSQTAIPNLIVERDIQEPKPDFGGRIWMYGGGEGARKPVATRPEACQYALRDMDETIALEAKLRSFSGVERRTDCICSYSAHHKSWACRAYYLTRVNSAQGNSR